MKSWNCIWIKQNIHVWIYLRAFRERIENSSRIFERKSKEKIYTKITIIDKIFNSFRIKKGWKTSLVYWLSKVERNNDKESILIVQYQRITKSFIKSHIFYHTRFEKSLQLDTHENKRRMKNNFSNSIWTLWILDNVVWAHQRLDNMSRNDQRCITRALECVCCRVFRWYIDVFQNINETKATCTHDVIMFRTTTIIIQIKEMRISSIEG